MPMTKGSSGAEKYLRRPFHETRKVVNEDGLDLVFGRRIRAGRRLGGIPSAPVRRTARPEGSSSVSPRDLSINTALNSTRVGSGTPYSG